LFFSLLSFFVQVVRLCIQGSITCLSNFFIFEHGKQSKRKKRGKREAGLFSRRVLFWLGCLLLLSFPSCSISWMSCVGRPSRLLTSEKQKEEREKQACFQEEFCFGWVASFFCLSLYVRCPEYHVCGSSITFTYEQKAKRREEQACSQHCVFWLSCFFSSSFSSSFFPVVGC